MSLAHLAIFQGMEIVDWPVPKMLDIFVCQTSENKAFLAKRSNRPFATVGHVSDNF